MSATITKANNAVATLQRMANDTTHDLVEAVLRWRNAHRAVARHRARHTPYHMLVELQFATEALKRLADKL